MSKCSGRPYLSAIEKLKNIMKVDTPIDKLRIFTQSSNIIVESIDEFWQGFVDEKHVRANDVTLTADDLPLICMYNTLQSGVYELYAHLLLI
jgi:hypothetical protein